MEPRVLIDILSLKMMIFKHKKHCHLRSFKLVNVSFETKWVCADLPVKTLPWWLHVYLHPFGAHTHTSSLDFPWTLAVRAALNLPPTRIQHVCEEYSEKRSDEHVRTHIPWKCQMKKPDKLWEYMPDENAKAIVKRPLRWVAGLFGIQDNTSGVSMSIFMPRHTTGWMLDHTRKC